MTIIWKIVVKCFGAFTFNFNFKTANKTGNSLTVKSDIHVPLPDDAMYEIFRSLTYQDVKSLRQVSSCFNNLSTSWLGHSFRKIKKQIATNVRKIDCGLNSNPDELNILIFRDILEGILNQIQVVECMLQVFSVSDKTYLCAELLDEISALLTCLSSNAYFEKIELVELSKLKNLVVKLSLYVYSMNATFIDLKAVNDTLLLANNGYLARNENKCLIYIRSYLTLNYSRTDDEGENELSVTFSVDTKQILIKLLQFAEKAGALVLQDTELLLRAPVERFLEELSGLNTVDHSQSSQRETVIIIFEVPVWALSILKLATKSDYERNGNFEWTRYLIDTIF